MPHKRWCHDEVDHLLNYMAAHVKTYTTGVKERFYEGACEYLANRDFDKTKKQCKTKCSELEGCYKQYKIKLSQSGFGLQASDPPSIKEMLQKKCPYYYEMDAIFGERHNANPPVLMEPGRVLSAEQGTEDVSADGASVSSSQRTESAASGNSSSAEATPSGNSHLGKRTYTAAGATTVAGSSSLHDALMRSHAEKSERREKRHQKEVEIQQQQLVLQREQVALQREDLRLREKKMEQQFALLCKQLELDQERKHQAAVI